MIEVNQSVLQNPAKLKKSKKKQPTAEITKELIAEGKSIEEIAIARRLKFNTIISHLLKIYETDPKFDLSKFKPDSKILKKISLIIKKIEKVKNKDDFDQTGKVKISRIFHALKYEVSYDDIKLALVFI